MLETLFTVGHSNHPIGHFLDLLKQHRVAVLHDVRSAPFSRYNPQYNRPALRAALLEAGIGYVYDGAELGGRNSRLCCQGNAVAPVFRDALENLCRAAGQNRIAIMCAEKEPLNCHRTHLVARHLRGVDIRHIHADGRLEAHADAMARQSGGQGDLFGDAGFPLRRKKA